MKNNNLFWIAGIALLLLVVAQNLNQEDGFTTFKFRYYDENKNEIDFQPYNYEEAMKQTFSIMGIDILEDDSSIDKSLLDDTPDTGKIEEEDLIEHNLDNGPPIIEEDDYRGPSFLENLVANIKSLISQIGTFGIVTTTKTITIPASNTDTYCRDRGDTPQYDFDADDLNDIGSDQITGGIEICNGLMQFPVTGIPSDLTAESQIQSVVLYYKTQLIRSDEGNGAEIDFCVIDDLQNYDWTPNDENEEEIMYNRLEDCSSNDFIYTYSFRDGIDENKWFGHEIVGERDVAYEIIDNRDGSPDNVLAIGMEGELDYSDDERVDFDNEDSVDKPYIKVRYTVSTCVPATCSSLGKQCGSWSNTCSGTLNCGTCASDYSCNINGKCIYDPTYISPEITITNTGNVDLFQVRIVNASPIEFLNALNLTDFRTLNIGQSTTWSSGLIEVKPEWKSTTTPFEVFIEGLTIHEEIPKDQKSGKKDLVLYS